MQSRDLTNNSDVYAANTKRLTMAGSRNAQAEKRSLSLSQFARIIEYRRPEMLARASERRSSFSGNLGMRHMRYQPTPVHKAVQSIRAKSIRLFMSNEISSIYPRWCRVTSRLSIRSARRARYNFYSYPDVRAMNAMLDPSLTCL